MDNALARCAGGLGSIPAVRRQKGKNSDSLSPSLHNAVGHKNVASHDNLRDLASPLSSNNANTSHAIHGQI